MKFVKALVVTMGLLIVLGMGLLVYGFITRFGKGPAPETPTDSAPLVPLNQPVSGFGDVPVPLDAGEILIEMQTQGTRLLLRTKMPDGTEAIRVFDLETGVSLGRFVLGK